MDNPLYRKKDIDKVNVLHPDLKAVVLKSASMGTRFIVIETTRGKASQNQAKASGHSNARFGQSPHNYVPALAVDLGPWNYPGKLADYHELALRMQLAARELKIGITWGGDWHSLKDWPHFELSNWKAIARSETLAS